MAGGRDNGGPAFPRLETLCDRDMGGREYQAQSSSGLSMRDYFAAKALQGILACYTGDVPLPPYKVAALKAYDYADAMLEARK